MTPEPFVYKGEKKLYGKSKLQNGETVEVKCAFVRSPEGGWNAELTWTNLAACGEGTIPEEYMRIELTNALRYELRYPHRNMPPEVARECGGVKIDAFYGEGTAAQWDAAIVAAEGIASEEDAA